MDHVGIRWFKGKGTHNCHAASYSHFSGMSFDVRRIRNTHLKELNYEEGTHRARYSLSRVGT